MLVVSLFVVLFILFFIWFYFEKRKYKDLDKLPGPPASWFLGNITEFGTDGYDSFESCRRIVKTYGRLVRIWQGPLRVNLFITDPVLTEYFLSSNVHIKKSAGYDIFQTWLGDGLITASGEIWKKHRKILTPAFHFNVLEQFASSFHKNAQIMVGILKQHSGKAIDICETMKHFALDSLCGKAYSNEMLKYCENNLQYLLNMFAKRHI